ncbi:MAG TPA: DUF4397 domain-containing protein [Methylibium sp.]|uniref:DUF4397 domain-containing protein n=1 Tax=Methylibium sp. TaxID=2067992 RepID=UPI002DB6F03A|nr:DUF4397 domain-containing protein [Methylibium sp.]HEU4459137.1 DUF4397 domain-containing protein [Methylibium sp.]
MTDAVNHARRATMIRALGLTLASSGLLVACGGGDDDDDIDDRADLADPKLRFVHAVPGAPNVTLVRNGNPESNATNVPYKYGSQYYDVGTDTTGLSLRVASTNAEVATTSFPARRGNRYTTIALPTTSGVELLTIDDPYNKSLTSDNARVRFVNAAVNAQSFDVYLTAPGVDLATVSPRIGALGYKQVVPATTADSIEIEGGNYQIRLTPAGSKTAFFSTAAVAVPRNGDWLFVALPDDGAIATPNRVRLLLVRADDSADATDELTSTV